MKVQNITDIDKFFKVVDSCKGKVELVTGEGDRLNLKSKLSQYVSMANIFSNGEIPELEIIAYEKEDIDRLVSFYDQWLFKNGVRVPAGTDTSFFLPKNQKKPRKRSECQIGDYSSMQHSLLFI